MLAAGQIRRHIGTYVGENKLLESMVLTGKIQLDLVPQGTFSERIRAAGLRCEIGRFQEIMTVELVNEGPVTILLDSGKGF